MLVNLQLRHDHVSVQFTIEHIPDACDCARVQSIGASSDPVNVKVHKAYDAVNKTTCIGGDDDVLRFVGVTPAGGSVMSTAGELREQLQLMVSCGLNACLVALHANS